MGLKCIRNHWNYELCYDETFQGLANLTLNQIHTHLNLTSIINIWCCFLKDFTSERFLFQPNLIVTIVLLLMYFKEEESLNLYIRLSEWFTEIVDAHLIKNIQMKNLSSSNLDPFMVLCRRWEGERWEGAESLVTVELRTRNSRVILVFDHRPWLFCQFQTPSNVSQSISKS